jgi:chromate transporter
MAIGTTPSNRAQNDTLIYLQTLTATAGLFAPGVILMLVISHQYGRFRGDQRAEQFLAGVNPAVTGLIMSAAVSLSRTTLLTWHAYLALGLALFLLVRLRWHPAIVLSLGAASGHFGLLP